MGTKHAFPRAGFAFRYMPIFMVEADVARVHLRAIRIETPGAASALMAMHAVYRKKLRPDRWAAG
jgi:hypothetical protein